MPNRFTIQSKFLTRLSVGQGAVRLPYNATSLTLKFKTLNKYGHMGARKFWKEYLPKIQFHNPNLAISVIRTSPQSKEDEENEPASLSVIFNDRPPFELDIKNMRSEAILHQFINGTSAEQVNLNKFPVGKPDLRRKMNA
ncbi:hypothetical protein V1512DRAFT_258862 [Lipomyces arxii]|uniref:mitochondrial 54S ribosomal protein mL61 n=1 Tax=Lipomyces arxii TaxID=56418 RepID=UPI0034CFD4E9